MWHRDKLQAVDDYLNENPDCVAVNHPVWWFRQEGISAVKAYGFSIDFAAESLDQCHAAVADGDPSQNDWSYLDIRGRSFEHLLERNRGALSASVLKREVYQAAGGLMPALTSADDWLLFLSVSRNAEWHTVPRRLAFCRQHGAQSTADVDNVRAILAAFNIAWHGGRPFPDKVDAADFARRLDDYRDEYRRMSQSFMRMAVRARRWDLIPIIRALSRPILAHRSDRMFALLPSRVTSRLWRND
jgi:hypothetical protein